MILKALFSILFFINSYSLLNFQDLKSASYYFTPSGLYLNFLSLFFFNKNDLYKKSFLLLVSFNICNCFTLSDYLTNPGNPATKLQVSCSKSTNWVYLLLILASSFVKCSSIISSFLFSSIYCLMNLRFSFNFYQYYYLNYQSLSFYLAIWSFNFKWSNLYCSNSNNSLFNLLLEIYLLKKSKFSSFNFSLYSKSNFSSSNSFFILSKYGLCII